MTDEEILKLVKVQAGFVGNAMNIPQDTQRNVEALVWDYNQARPTDITRRRELLRKILGTYNDHETCRPILWLSECRLAWTGRLPLTTEYPKTKYSSDAT